ncbi:hypothetical protein V5G94_24705, partial [Citrobacter braakii]
VCAGAPAKKWIANADPKGDQEIIDSLIDCLDSIECKTFILIRPVVPNNSACMPMMSMPRSCHQSLTA